MDWSEILNIVLGGTSLVTIVGFLAYRKQNKRIKDNEVKSSDVDTQRQQIELAELYKDKVLELMEQVSTKQDTGNENQQRILDKLDKLDGRVDKQEVRLSDIVAYLNGDFQNFLKVNRHEKRDQDSEGAR